MFRAKFIFRNTFPCNFSISTQFSGPNTLPTLRSSNIWPTRPNRATCPVFREGQCTLHLHMAHHTYAPESLTRETARDLLLMTTGAKSRPHYAYAIWRALRSRIIDRFIISESVHKRSHQREAHSLWGRGPIMTEAGIR